MAIASAESTLAAVRLEMKKAEVSIKKCEGFDGVSHMYDRQHTETIFEMKTSGIFKDIRQKNKKPQHETLTLTNGPLRRTSDHDDSGYRGDRLRINVSGLYYETRVSTLERFPNTLLGDPKQREVYYDGESREVFLDRDRECFEFVLRFYQTGGLLVKPSVIPEDIFFKELRFFQLDKFVQKLPTKKETTKKRKMIVMPRGKKRLMIWRALEEPGSSIYAKILSVISVSIIMISIWNFCLETLPTSKQMWEDLCMNETYNQTIMTTNSTNNQTYTEATRCRYALLKYPFFIIETFCVIYFTLEVLVRFIVSPEKVEFCKSGLNIVDTVSVIPYFVQLTIDLATDGIVGGFMGASDDSFSSLIVLRVLRLVRILRIFKLSRYFAKLRVLWKTLRASAGELAILVFFIFVAMIIFSTIVYFCEASSGEGNKFDSIPSSFWWAVVTMTTVGYGDVVPRTVLGKIVGFVCAITGVLCIALPVPSIVNNFVKQLEIMEQEKRTAMPKQQISIIVSDHGEENGERILKAMTTSSTPYKSTESIALN